MTQGIQGLQTYGIKIALKSAQSLLLKENTMNVTDKNQSMWGLLNQSYTQQNTKSDNVSGYSDNSHSSFGTQNAKNTQEVDAITSLFDLGSKTTTQTTTEIQDSFEMSAELSKLQEFAKQFSMDSLKKLGNWANLGNAMQQSGLLSPEEKIGFDILQKFNPNFDSTQTQNLLQNGNLSKESVNLLSQVDRKVNVIRYFGGF